MEESIERAVSKKRDFPNAMDSCVRGLLSGIGGVSQPSLSSYTYGVRLLDGEHWDSNPKITIPMLPTTKHFENILFDNRKRGTIIIKYFVCQILVIWSHLGEILCSKIEVAQKSTQIKNKGKIIVS